MQIKPIHHNHSVCCIVYHFVITKKYRRENIPDEVIGYIRQAITKYPITILEGNVGDTELKAGGIRKKDHVHLVVQSDVTLSPMQIARYIKGCTTPIMRRINPNWQGWGRGYFIGAGSNAIDELIAYVQNQEME